MNQAWPCRTQCVWAFAFAVSAVWAVGGAASAEEEPGYRWTNVTMKAAFAPRDGAGALVYGGKMWLIGGWNPPDKVHFPRKCNNEVWSSADGQAWTLEKPNTYTAEGFDPANDWESRHTAGYVVHQDKMWIVGGDPLQGHYQYDVWNSADGKAWTQVNKGHDVPWGPRALHHTVAFQNKIWVMGGQTTPQFAPAEERFYDDIWNSADGIHWTQVQPEGPRWPARGMIGGSAVFQDRMWILGGGTYDTPDTPERKFYNDVWSSPDGIHWECHAEHTPWHPRQYHEVAVFDNRLWVLEGWNKGNRNDVWHSSDGVDWHEVPNTPWKPRHAASVFVYDGALWMVAGNNMESDVWKLPRTGSPTRPAPYCELGSTPTAHTIPAWGEPPGQATNQNHNGLKAREWLGQPLEERGTPQTVFAGCGVDEFNYGIHGYALLSALMGPGVEAVFGSTRQRLPRHRRPWPRRVQ